jgi:hypothetical protein
MERLRNASLAKQLKERITYVHTLEERWAAEQTARITAEREARKAKSERVKAEERVAEYQRRFDDLKVRLQGALAANEYIRGYLARVGEDDTVREELITTGEPGGEQQFVPKRRKPRHWVTY